MAQSAERHKEYNRIYMRKWNKKHRKRLLPKKRKWSAAWRRRHAEYNREYQRRWAQSWYRAHPIISKRRTHAWSKANPHKKAFLQSKVRAKRHGIAGSYTLQQWLDKIKRHNWKCFYCLKKLNKRTLQADHSVPIQRGGSNYLRNVVPCCKSCNTRKHTLTRPEFIRSKWNPRKF